MLLPEITYGDLSHINVRIHSSGKYVRNVRSF